MASSPRIQLIEATDALLDEALIKERDEQIHEIQKDMSTIKELFIELAGLVQNQGPDIIHTSHNIKKTEMEVEIGTAQLEKAYDKSWRCIVL